MSNALFTHAWLPCRASGWRDNTLKEGQGGKASIVSELDATARSKHLIYRFYLVYLDFPYTLNYLFIRKQRIFELPS